MTLVTGTVQDLGYDGMDGTLWARPARFRSDGSVVLAPERKPYKITGGVVSAELAPGPAVLELQVGSHARGTFEVVIPDKDTTLADLLDTVFPWEPEQVSLFVAERLAAEQAKADAEQAATLAATAKTDAELAAQQTGQDRTAVAADKDTVVAHVQALAEPNDAAVLGLISEGADTATKAALNATYGTKAELASKVDAAQVAAQVATGLNSRIPTVDPNGWRGGLVGFQGVEVPIPIPGYTIPVTVVKEGSGYGAIIDVEAMHPRTAGKTVYVDPVAGNNAWDGLTWETAKKSPGEAVFDSGAYGVAEVIVRGGIYARVDSNVGGFSRPDLIVRAEPGTRPVFTQGDRSTAWVAHAGNAWTVPLSGDGTVYDITAHDATASGIPLPLRKVGSAQEVVDTPGSAYSDGTNVWVHCKDGRKPDANVLVERATYHLNWGATPKGYPRALLLEGVEFWGGQFARLKADVPGYQLVAKNTAWRFATSGNGVSVEGVETVVLIECEATLNYADGFNYHDVTGLSGQVLEVNCTGALNGRVPGSQNGSTAHDNYKILRVGGTYEFNYGPNVADVNNTRSANFGVAAGYATGNDFDFAGPGTTGSMWLIGCRSSGNPKSIDTRGGKIYLRDFVGQGVTSGTVAPYA